MLLDTLLEIAVLFALATIIVFSCYGILALFLPPPIVSNILLFCYSLHK